VSHDVQFYISYPFIEPGDSTSKLLACIKEVIFHTSAWTLAIQRFSEFLLAHSGQVEMVSQFNP